MPSHSVSSLVQSPGAFLGAGVAQPCTLALSVEFVAKPEQAGPARAFLPEAVLGALKEVDGFAGCVVLSSDQESRLVTVITFWTGSNSRKCCEQNVRWVKALVARYADRCLRVQTLVAHAPALAPEAIMPEQATDEETGSVMQECEVAGNPCVA